MNDVIESVRMDIWADTCTAQATSDGMYIMQAVAGERVYEWRVSAIVFWWRNTDAINAIVDAFRQQFKKVGC